MRRGEEGEEVWGVWRMPEAPFCRSRWSLIGEPVVAEMGQRG